jgi:hypothetical protein
MAYRVERSAPFSFLVEEIKLAHPKIEADLAWLEGRLAQGAECLGDRVPGLLCALPVMKTRCKDSCCSIGASGGWRIYFTLDKAKRVVCLFFIAHKRVAESAGKTFLNQQIARAFGPGPTSAP